MMVDVSWHGKKPMSAASEAPPPPSGAHAYVYACFPRPSSPPRGPSWKSTPDVMSGSLRRR
uniref:Uncharacterized protein n=1 Tax=Arundo donax TaxID=35708 RepID=A0A0A9EIM9_ARUDO